ncbi:MAG: hypothetical protein M3P45_02865 [Acidobacteriota bacterium]|nr:hypothetical protein [Acidobacteriota bacterium]
MKRAAIGFRMHSGWGALVAVSQNAGAVEILERRRIVVIEAKITGTKQPYHFSERLDFPAAEKFLTTCFAASRQLALAAIREAIESLRERQYSVAGAAIVLASGRVLPPLAKILASHALIHTAEGEFFREAIWKACQALDIPVTGFRERDLHEAMAAGFEKAASKMLRQVASAGRSVGPPWTTDQKTAALAALLALSNKQKGIAHFCREPNFQYLHLPLLK